MKHLLISVVLLSYHSITMSKTKKNTSYYHDTSLLQNVYSINPITKMLCYVI